MRTLQTLIACSLLFCAEMYGQCVSSLRDASSGVFNRTTTAVAWSGTVAGVGKVDESAQRAIWFATYSENLTQLTGDRKVADASFVGVNALVWTGSEFGLFYQVASSRQLVLQRISASGELIGDAVPVAPNHAPATDREYDVAFDRSSQLYVVAHSVFSGFDRGIWVTFLNRDGSLRTEQIITTTATPPANPRIAVNDSGAIGLIFFRNGTFNFQTISPAGVPGTIQPSIAARAARIATNGRDFAVVGSVPLTTASNTIDWMVFDERGAVLMPEATLVTARGAEIAPVSLYWNASRAEWALAYLDSEFGFSQIAGNYRLRRFTASGELISDSMFAHDPVFTRLTTPLPFTWTGTSYLTAASRASAGSTPPASFLLRHCTLTTSIRATSHVRQLELVTFSANVDGGASDPTFTWNFGDSPRTETGQTVVHRYERLGVYKVTLRTTDSSGATTVSTFTVNVIIPKRRAVKH